MDVTETLQEARRRLDTSWEHDVMPLRVSQLVRRDIAPHMGKYGNAGVLIMRYWYVDYALAGCRRIAGRHSDEMSFQQALTMLRGVADELTSEVLMEYHRAIGNPEADEGPAAFQSAIERTVAAARPDDTHADTSVIGRATVQADLTRLNRAARRAADLATLRTAHRLTPERIEARGGDITVTVEEVDELLDTVAAIYQRWSDVLRRVSVHTSIDHFTTAAKLERALRLYDNDAYMKAILEHNGSRTGGPVSLRHLHEHVQASYEVDER